MLSLAFMNGAFFVGMLRTRVDRNRAPHPGVGLWVSSGSGVRCFCGQGGVWRKGRVFSLSNEIELVMVSEEVRARYE